MNKLPRNFDASLLSEIERSKIQQFYSKYVQDYYDQYQFGHFIFAAYCAVPVLLSPDLLYKLWLNFRDYQWAGKPARIHQIAISDVLLSSICNEVGYELYEIQTDIRTALLAWLNEETGGTNSKKLYAPEQIAGFVVEYTQLPNAPSQLWGEGYAEAQLWNAYSFSDPQKAIQVLLSQLNRATRESDRLRILDALDKTQTRLDVLLDEEAKTEIKDFEKWHKFSEAWKALIQQNNRLFLDIVKKNPQIRDLLSKENNGGIALQMSREVKTELELLDQEGTTTVFALLAGIDEYAGPNVPTLRGCAEDALDFSELFRKISIDGRRLYEEMILLNEQANSSALSAITAHFQNMQPGDTAVIYFAGLSKILELTENKGRKLIFYNSYMTDPEQGIWQYDLEEAIYSFVAKKEVHFLLIFDTHDAEAAYKEGLQKNKLRRNASSISGSVVILNAGGEGGKVDESNIKGRVRGYFSYHLQEVLREGGIQLSYRQLIDKIKLRFIQNEVQQTPTIEAFPSAASAFIFMQHQANVEQQFTIRFDTQRSEWVLNAGSLQGITPSLGYMLTKLKVFREAPDNPVQSKIPSYTQNVMPESITSGLGQEEVIVEKVYEDYSTLREFQERDQNLSFAAELLQKALPKVKVAFDGSMDNQMRSRFEDTVKRYDLYFIDLIGDQSEASFIIKAKDRQYFLVRASDNSGKPVFQYQEDPFEFIRQLEYIAQWAGVLEFDQSNLLIPKSAIEISIGKIEGSVSYEDDVEANEILPGQNAQIIDFHYRKKDGKWIRPALQCRITSTAEQPHYIHFLYLDSTYGIREFSAAELNPGRQVYLTEKLSSGKEYRTLPLYLDDAYLALGITEIYDYLKIFIADQPLELRALLQEGLSFDSGTARKVAALPDRVTFDISGINWTSVTIPFRIIRSEEEAWTAGGAAESESIPKEKAYHIHPLQWALHPTMIGQQFIDQHIEVEAAWALSTGRETTIAVIDDGIDIDHPEFKGKIIAPRDAGSDTDNPRPRSPAENHGTAVAGIACARGLKNGMAGVAPDARLMPIRTGGLGSLAEAKAFEWAADHGADVISCSWGPPDGAWWNANDPQHTQSFELPEGTRKAIAYAVEKGRDGKGCVIVWSAGNGNEDIRYDGYASNPQVITVAACNDRGKRSIYSDYGDNVWCCFPSSDHEFPPLSHPKPLTEGIRTTDRTGKTGYDPDDYTNSFGGTAAAAPGVAGVVALILSINPGLHWYEVKEIIKLSCDKIDPEGGEYDAGGHSKYYGYGRINAAKAVENAKKFTRGQKLSRVLWVDDTPSNNIEVRKRLADHDIIVDLAWTTEEALEKLRQHEYDHIISDMGRKEEGKYHRDAGVNLFRQIRSMNSKASLIIYTVTRLAEGVDKSTVPFIDHITASTQELYEILGI